MFIQFQISLLHFYRSIRLVEKERRFGDVSDVAPWRCFTWRAVGFVYTKGPGGWICPVRSLFDGAIAERATSVAQDCRKRRPGSLEANDGT